MKTIPYILLGLLPTFTFSQTLTQSFNEPVAGDSQSSVILDTTAFASGMPLSLVGSNKIWDFTKLKATDNSYLTSYVAPETNSASVNFPGSTLLQNEPGLSTFLKSASSPSIQTEVLGVLSNSFSVTFTNSALAIVYPFAMGSSCTDNLAGTFTLGTLTGNCSGKITTTAEGTGTLMLPDGFVYNNVLRIKSVQTVTATQFFVPLGTIKQTLISYFDISQKFPILSISYNAITLGFGTPTVSALCRGNSGSFIVGISEKNHPEQLVSIFPNPTKGIIQIRFNPNIAGRWQFELRNVMGQLVKVASAPESGPPTFDLSEFPPGLYQLTMVNNRSTYTTRIVRE